MRQAQNGKHTSCASASTSGQLHQEKDCSECAQRARTASAAAANSGTQGREVRREGSSGPALGAKCRGCRPRLQGKSPQNIQKRLSVKRKRGHVTRVGHTSLSNARVWSGERSSCQSKMWHPRATLAFPRFRTRRTEHGPAREETAHGAAQGWALMISLALRTRARRQGRGPRPVSGGVWSGRCEGGGSGRACDRRSRTV